MSSSKSWMEETQPGYPMLPDLDDPRWQDATVRARTQKHTELRNVPRPGSSTVFSAVYAGDVISIMRDIRYTTWIAARVGYKVGWLDTVHVDFVLMRQFDSPASSDRPRLRRSIPEPFMEQMEAVGIPSPMSDPDVKLTPKEVNRIIRYLKGIASTLKIAKDRAEEDLRDDR